MHILAAALAAALDITDAFYGAVSSQDALTPLFESLAADDTPAEQTARVHARLAQFGVDVEAIKADRVTHTTVRTHLRECLDVARTVTISPGDARDTIELAGNRCANAVAQTCTRLRNADIVATGPLNVTVTIRITCTTWARHITRANSSPVASAPALPPTTHPMRHGDHSACGESIDPHA